MKIVTLTPAIISMAVLLCSPIGLAVAYGTAQQAGLVCYCCSGQTCTCTMFSCPKCNTDTGSPEYNWTPDLIRPSFQIIVHFQPVISEPELFYPPETVYQKARVKPPPSL